VTATSVMMVEPGIGPIAPARDKMPSGIALSATLHIGMIALILLGLPNLFRHPPPEETPIAVELVTIAPETRATHPNPYRPKPEAKPEPPVAAPAPRPEPKPEPPPMAAEPPPSAAAPPPPVAPQPPKPEIKPAPLPPPPPPKPVEAQAAPMPPPRPPEPKPKPEPQQAHQPPRPDLRKPDSAAFDKLIKHLEEKRPEDKRPEPAQFDALLKNLTQQQTAQAEDAPPARPVLAAGAPPSSQPRAPLGSQLTASEIDLIRQQIEQCWNVPAGARDAQDLDVEIKAVVNPDGTVRQAAIVDTGRYGTDPNYRAAADSAKRAILNPQCSPLHVPPDKYEAWHNLDLIFNPKDLL